MHNHLNMNGRIQGNPFFNNPAPKASNNVTPIQGTSPGTLNYQFATPLNEAVLVPDGLSGAFDLPAPIKQILKRNRDVQEYGVTKDSISEIFSDNKVKKRQLAPGNDVNIGISSSGIRFNTPIPDQKTLYGSGLNTRSNYYIPDTKIIVTTEGVMSKSHRDQVLFFRRQNPVNQSSKARRGDGARYVGLSLPLLNLTLAETYKTPKGHLEVMTADEVWNNWVIHGPVRTEGTGEKTTREFDLNNKERVITLTERGRCSVMSNWDSGNIPFTPCYYILMQVPMRETYRVDVDGYTTRDLEINYKGIQPKPFQLIPWSNSKKGYPSLDELRYTDEFGIPRLAKVIKFGRVEDPDDPMSSYCAKNVSFDEEAILRQPKIMVLVDC